MTRKTTQTMIDSLEPRQHLAADGILQVKSVVADNRGRVIVAFDEAGKNFSKNTVRVFKAGPDGELGNADDIRITAATLSYSPSTFKLTIKTMTDKNQVYRIRLEDDIRSAQGSNKLDGEFHGGSSTSGNGTAGGDYKFRTVRDNSDNPFVRFDTSFGSVKIKVYKDKAPISAGAFLDLVNGGKFDGLVVSRAVPNFVVQLGSMRLTGDANDAHDIDEQSVGDSFGPETPRVMSNVRGTLSFARGGAQSLATNQFFFNLAANTFLDTAQGNSPVFTPFAEVVSGMSAIDAMGNAQTVALVNSWTSSPDGILQDDQDEGRITATGLSDVPVQTLAGLSTQNIQVQSTTIKIVTGDFTPRTKLVVFSRSAVQMKVVAST